MICPNANAVLEEWINQTDRSWKAVVVRGVVSEEEAQQVLQVQIPLIQRPDALRWPFEKQGRLTARSAYHFICDQQGGGRAESNDQRGRSSASTEPVGSNLAIKFAAEDQSLRLEIGLESACCSGGADQARDAGLTGVSYV